MQAPVSWDEHIEKAFDYASQAEWIQFKCNSETVISVIGNKATESNAAGNTGISETENCSTLVGFAAQVSTLQNDM